MSVASDADAESFAAACAATLYLLGERGESIVQMSGGLFPSAASRALARGEHATRVAVLAREAARIALALEAACYPRAKRTRSEAGHRWR